MLQVFPEKGAHQRNQSVGMLCIAVIIRLKGILWTSALIPSVASFSREIWVKAANRKQNFELKLAYVPNVVFFLTSAVLNLATKMYLTDVVCKPEGNPGYAHPKSFMVIWTNLTSKKNWLSLCSMLHSQFM